MSPATLLPRPRPALAVAAALALGLAAAGPAAAQFALAVSPPRLELAGAPGATLREAIELTHADGRPGRYRVKTADWTLRPDGSVDFSDALLPGSCRPWVAIERRALTLAPRRPYRFRLEVAPPAGTPPTECRFAVMIESDEPATAPGLPVALGARIGVIVYVAVGEVAPVLSLAGHAVRQLDGRATPVVAVRNDGQAHGRLAGFIGARDAAGRAIELQPGSTPVMPGETREIPLVATRVGDTETAVQAAFPLQVDGRLEWGRDGSLPLSLRFVP